MNRALRVIGLVALAGAAVALTLPVGCSTGPGPTPTPTPTATPTPGPGDFSRGWSAPDPAVVESRQEAINPYGASANVALPASADLTQFLPPVSDQGQQSSCVAFAVGYAGASYTANRQFDWGANTPAHQASPGYLYAKLLESDGFDCGSGTLVDTGITLLIQDGCASLASINYSDTECFDNPSIADGANFRVGSRNRVEPTNRDGIRGELAAGRIVVIGAELYTDFMDYRGTPEVFVGNGDFLTEGSQHAGHALAVVGYDNARGAYRIMNSWTPQWGDNGFMWMKYETFEDTVKEAYSLEPTAEHNPPVDPGTDTNGPPPTTDPEGFLDDAYQFADVDENNTPVVYLVFNWHFSAPVLIRTITVTDPDGQEGQQEYNTWFTDGYVYFVQSGGFQWKSGNYHLEFDTQTQAGNDINYSGDAFIAPLEEGGAGELCLNTCFFAFDGECDDGGPGSAFDVCDFGTDCADCGSRSDGGDQGVLCDDTCVFANDGSCDDGGEGADFADCNLGSDCTDCGPRTNDGGGGGDVLLCDDSCQFAGDGTCDDGGEGSDNADCDFGSDCLDCGIRVEAAKVATPTHRAPNFRGIPQRATPAAAALPAAGVQDGVLGGNRKPVVIIPKAD